MDDLFRLFRTAEDKIVILSPVVGGILATKLQSEASFYHEKMADVVVRTEKVRVEVRLEMGLKMLLQIRRHLVLIGVDHISLVLFNRGSHLKKGVGSQKIVVVEKGKIIACGHPDRRVGVACNALVFLKTLVTDSLILRLVLLHHLFHGNILPASVGDTELQMRVGLIQHRLDHLP